MPHANPADKTARQRERRAEKAATRGVNPPPPGEATPSGEPPAPVKLNTAGDALAILREEIDLVRSGGNLNRARVVGYLVSTAIHAISAANYEGRIEALERALKLQGGAK